MEIEGEMSRTLIRLTVLKDKPGLRGFRDMPEIARERSRPAVQS